MSPFSFDVSADDFQRVVIEGSGKTPVIVDFWAEWCGPCRALKPILEKLATEYQGKFILAKVNSDENQQLASQYGVRGIPNVKAFVGGQLVDEFSGALPEGTVREFIDRLIPSPADELRLEAMTLHRGGDSKQALAHLARAAEIDPGNQSVRIDTAEVLLDGGQADEAKRLLDDLGTGARLDARVERLLARAEFAVKGRDLGDEAELATRVGQNAGDLEARLQLATLLAAQQRYEPALEQLLEITRRDRGFKDDIGRKTMLSLFNLMGGQGELVSKYRRLLASALN